ncbi:MAG: hypothetical protein ACI3ZD_09705, partial [Prevotella sp.]
MEIKYIKTLNHIKRCLEIDGLSSSMPPFGVTLEQYRINCEWLHENNYIEAIFSDDFCIVNLARLTNKGKAALSDYHDELLEKISEIATRNELATIQDKVLCKINARVFSKDNDIIDEIEVLEAITNITSSKNPKITTDQITEDLLEYIKNIPSADKLTAEYFIWLMKIYVILRYRFHDDKYYREVVFPILRDAMIYIKNNIYGKGNKDFLNELYEYISDDSTNCITLLDNLRKNDDYEYSNYKNNNCNTHSDKEYQTLLNKIQELEAENKRLKEENAELGHQIEKSSDETEEDRTFLYDEVKKNMYTGKIRACIILGLLNELLNGNITDKAKAAILTMNVAGYGSWGALE